MLAHNVRQVLDAHHVRYREVSHEARFTAQEAAEAAHVSGKRFAKTVVLRLLGDNGFSQYVMAVLPANEKVDLDRLAHLLGSRAVLASEKEIAALLPGIEAGAIPPLGELADLPVIVDRHLAETGWIVFHGGRLTSLVEMRWEAYRAMVEPRVFEYGRPRA